MDGVLLLGSLPIAHGVLEVHCALEHRVGLVLQLQFDQDESPVLLHIALPV